MRTDVPSGCRELPAFVHATAVMPLQHNTAQPSHVQQLIDDAVKDATKKLQSKIANLEAAYRERANPLWEGFKYFDASPISLSHTVSGGVVTVVAAVNVRPVTDKV